LSSISQPAWSGSCGSKRSSLAAGSRTPSSPRVLFALLTPVPTHWVTPTVGVSLVLTVSTQSLTLSAALAASERADWLLYAALAPFLLGLVFYVFVISRFDFRQLGVGRGDHWITGGPPRDLDARRRPHHTHRQGPSPARRRRRDAQSRLARALGAHDRLASRAARRRGAKTAAALRTSGAGQPCSHSACTPPAASSSAPSPPRPRSPTSRASGCGSAPPRGSWYSRRSSAAACSSSVASTHRSARGPLRSSHPASDGPRSRPDEIERDRARLPPEGGSQAPAALGRVLPT